MIDLPAAGGSNVGWGSHRDLVEATYNFIETAADAGIERYILGLTNRVVEAYELERAPEIYDADCEFTIDHTVPTRPVTL